MAGPTEAGAVPRRVPATALDLAACAMSPMYHLVLGCRLTFVEHLDPSTLKRAVRALLDEEPVLGSWLDEGLLGGQWRRCHQLDACVPFAVVETDNPVRDGATFHAEPFEAKGPRLAVRLMRSPEADELYLKVDHVPTDGRTTKELAYRLAGLYNRMLVDRSHSPSPDVTPRPTFKDLWAALSPEQREASRRPPRRGTPRWVQRLEAGADRGFTVRTLLLGPDRLAALKDVGRATQGATVNDLLLTALMRSVARISPPGPGVPAQMYVTADLRRPVERPEFERPCGLSTPQMVEVDSVRDSSFADDLRRVVAAVRPWKDCLWNPAILRITSVPHRAMRAVYSVGAAHFRRRGTLPPTLMNIGLLDEERLSFGGAVPVAGHVLGPVLAIPGFAATASTYRDVLTVWMGFYQEDTDPELIQQVLAGMDAELGSAVAGASA